MVELKDRRLQAALFLAGALAFDHAHDVGLFHDQQVLPVDLDLGAGPFSKKHPVARFDVQRNKLAAFVTGTRPDGDDLAFLRLLLCCVGYDDATLGLFLSFDAADDDTVVQWTEFHGFRSRLSFDADLRRKCVGFDRVQRAVDSRC